MTEKQNEQAKNNQQVKTNQLLSELIDGNMTFLREMIKDSKGNPRRAADGRQLYKYFVRGLFRGRTIEAQFDPKDVGGYEPLDILFEMPNKPVLVMSDESITDAKGATTNYVVYKVQVADENGEVFDCGVKPHGDSNKSLLKMILSSLKTSA